VARVTVRLTDRMAAQLEAVARERRMNCARFVRQLIAQAVAGQPVEGLGPPSEDELLELLSEKARMGNVAAIRTLLVREEQKDPRKAALALFEEMGARRQ
jgi:Ribbon-helix-helix protein, copG family